MSRQGCYFCKKGLQPFQYKHIGLCPPCRRKVAKRLSMPIRSTTLRDVPMANFSENAKGAQIEWLTNQPASSAEDG